MAVSLNRKVILQRYRQTKLISNERKKLIQKFHQLYHTFAPKIITWFGVQMKKCPLDMWVYHEIIFKYQPDYIIETGSSFDGSSLFKAMVCDVINYGEIIRILNKQNDPFSTHTRIKILKGQSTDPKLFAQIKSLTNGKKVLVFLGSDHSSKNIAQELKLYSDLVQDKGYIIVENTFKKTPTIAINNFLKSNRDFFIDTSQEKLLFTFNPGGFLKRSLDGKTHRKKSVVRSPVKKLRSISTDKLNNTILDFHLLYYGTAPHITRWFDSPLMKCPNDLWVYQEIITVTQPDLIIEAGTAYGGSALFLAMICDAIGHGEVITIDNRPEFNRVTHPRLTAIGGSSTDLKIFDYIKTRAQGKKKVMVILDSDHSEQHVFDELTLYNPLVTKGCYLVAEDTNVEGVAKAVTKFLSANNSFVQNKNLERYLMTYNAGGYLKRIA